MNMREIMNCVLLENAIDKAMNQFGQKALERAKQENINLSLPLLIVKIAEADPTKNNSYTNWLVRKYADGGIRRYEDLSRANQYLITYDQLKTKNKLTPEQKDINRIKTLSDLGELVMSHEKSIESNRDSKKKEEQELFVNGEAKLIYNDPDIKVVIPRTEKASCFFGKNTQWCTAATKGENQFEYYNKKGPLYIVLFKKNNERYQFHFAENQFMNENDNPVKPRELADKHPILYKIFKQISVDNNSLAFNKEPTEEEQIAAVSRRAYSIRLINKPSEKVQLAAVNKFADVFKFIHYPSEKVQIKAIEKAPHLIALIKNASDKLQLIAVNSSFRAIQYIDYPSEKIQLAAVKNNPLAIHYIEDPSDAVKKAAEHHDNKS